MRGGTTSRCGRAGSRTSGEVEQGCRGRHRRACRGYWKSHDLRLNRLRIRREKVSFSTVLIILHHLLIPYTARLISQETSPTRSTYTANSRKPVNRRFLHPEPRRSEDPKSDPAPSCFVFPFCTSSSSSPRTLRSHSIRRYGEVEFNSETAVNIFVDVIEDQSGKTYKSTSSPSLSLGAR